MQKKKINYSFDGNKFYTEKRVVETVKQKTKILINYVSSLISFGLGIALMILSKYLVMHLWIVYTCCFAMFFVGAVFLYNTKPTQKKEVEYFIHIPHDKLK